MNQQQLQTALQLSKQQLDAFLDRLELTDKEDFDSGEVNAIRGLVVEADLAALPSSAPADPEVDSRLASEGDSGVVAPTEAPEGEGAEAGVDTVVDQVIQIDLDPAFQASMPTLSLVRYELNSSSVTEIKDKLQTDSTAILEQARDFLNGYADHLASSIRADLDVTAAGLSAEAKARLAKGVVSTR